MEAGDKVAQLILGLSPNCDGLHEITADRERGSGGFGSTDEKKEVTFSDMSSAYLNTQKKVKEMMASPDFLKWIESEEGFRNTNCHAVATLFLKNGLSKHSTVTFLITNQPYAPLAVSDIMSIVDEADQMLKNEAFLKKCTVD
jgi:hypothetical protein